MRDKAKYLLIIDSGGARQALMLSADRAVVADFDASVEEVALMTQGLSPRTGASGRRQSASHLPMRLSAYFTGAGLVSQNNSSCSGISRSCNSRALEKSPA